MTAWCLARVQADAPVFAAIDFRGLDGQIVANAQPFSFKVHMARCSHTCSAVALGPSRRE